MKTHPDQAQVTGLRNDLSNHFAVLPFHKLLVGPAGDMFALDLLVDELRPSDLLGGAVEVRERVPRVAVPVQPVAVQVFDPVPGPRRCTGPVRGRSGP